ncbi:MAG TPA: hypothetical protein VGH87_20705 [Polyangiaceae bacterium]
MQKHALIACAAFCLFAACGGKVDGDAGVDASGSDAPMCTYQETRTSSQRTCTVATDCVVVERQLSCCKAQDEGIRKDAASKFQSDQAALTTGCPACGCDAQPQDELGNLGTSFTVTCDNGQCTAHAQ